VDHWTPQSWKSRLAAHQTRYHDAAEVERVIAQLGRLPPLVTSWEIERLKGLLADAQAGRRFVLQGGDCAESLDDCTPRAVTSKLKILLQMSLALVYGSGKPVVRIGRFAGQYAKPRSSPTETRPGETGGPDVSLPSYFGDLVNAPEFTAAARRPDPARMLQGYAHAAMTLNFIRSLVHGGFADLHHPEYWDLSFLQNADLPPELKAEYERMTASLGGGIRFMEALGEGRIEELTQVDFFASHEGLNLLYESAQTRRVPRREGYYDLTAHLPWIGERTRQLDGAHIEFFRGIENPVGVKLGPDCPPEEAVALARRLNPRGEPGKLVFITRMGVSRVREALPRLVEAVRAEQSAGGPPVLWLCDPMHGNTRTLASGVKTRSFDDIVSELEATIEIHRELAKAAGGGLGGVHFELTGEDVTECIGGAAGVTEAGLGLNYASACDPRLNYQQALEMAFVLSRHLR
jgi:3-deoxy-7-phosphoheptulonate synthase